MAASSDPPASDLAPASPLRQAFDAQDVDRVVGLLAEDVVFHSPVISDPGFHGRDAVAELLAMVFEAITDVRYTHDVATDGAQVLISDARVLGKPIKATMLLELDGDGQVREIWVMARPLVGVVAIAEAIGTRLADHRKPGQGRAIRAVSKPLAVTAATADRIGSRLIAALNRATA